MGRSWIGTRTVGYISEKWWEITIDGDTMNMTALSEDKADTKTYEMKRIEE